MPEENVRDRRRRRPRPRVLPEHRATPVTTCRCCTRTGRCTPATRRASVLTRALRAPTDAAARHRPRGVGADDRGDRAEGARTARPDPLRRLRGRRGAPRPAARDAAAVGRAGRPRDGPRRRSSPRRGPTASPPIPTRSTRTTARRRSGSATSGSSGTGASAVRQPRRPVSAARRSVRASTSSSVFCEPRLPSRKPRDEPPAPPEPGAHQRRAASGSARRAPPRRPACPIRPTTTRRARRRTPRNAAAMESARYRPSLAPMRIPSRAKTAPFSGCISANTGQSSAHCASTTGRM